MTDNKITLHVTIDCGRPSQANADGFAWITERRLLEHELVDGVSIDTDIPDS